MSPHGPCVGQAAMELVSLLWFTLEQRKTPRRKAQELHGGPSRSIGLFTSGARSNLR